MQHFRGDKTRAQKSAEPSSGLKAQIHHPSQLNKKKKSDDLDVVLQFLLFSVAFLKTASHRTLLYSELWIKPSNMKQENAINIQRPLHLISRKKLPKKTLH